jgi:hypothetical protein
MDGILHGLLIGTSAINLIVLAVLIYIYAKNFKHIRSKYNIGLTIFSVLFFIENALVLHLGLFQWPAIASDIIVFHMAVINIIQFFGLLVLLYITWK